MVKHGDARDTGGWYLVFQRSCAALTLARAVSLVNGGTKLAIDDRTTSEESAQIKKLQEECRRGTGVII